MKKYADLTKISDTNYHAVDYKIPASAGSNNLLRDSAVDRVCEINSIPLAFIDAKDGVQGGKYCFRGTRVPISAIKESIMDGEQYNKISATLKKYFRLNISPEEIKNAVREYDQIVNEIE